MVTLRGFTVILALGAVLAATACGNDETAASKASPSPTVTSVPAPSTEPAAPTEAPGADPGQMFTADPTLVGAHPLPFTSWTRVAADRIAVHFESGVPECYGVDATVSEDAGSVTVALRQGTRADATDKMCVMMAVFGTLEIQLSGPLGDRTVLSAV
ncbi:hypothetical protein [Nocardia jinanensis]|uniref:Large secreted protein n=1 Tax=Nocardia jinanensis TaxID=382504 RepID=A0A917RXR8_9NOCA|nr:hypothetical protein [Nocardia jinanensis]GGL42666.1 hypothetical protein GCM10011588_66700 [Nocardia jinanensis]